MKLLQILFINSGFVFQLQFIFLLHDFDPLDFFDVFRGHIRLEILSF